MGEAGAGHLLFDAPVCEEVLLYEVYHFVEHGYCLVDDGDDEVAEFFVI